MRILVLMKQVPEPGTVRFIAQINRIERAGIAAITNPLDAYALDYALAIRQSDDEPGEVVVATMGPPDAESILRSALARGADRAIHLCDLAFAGADSLATARVFARLVEIERPDLVLTGRSTLDGATAQVTPQLAELAGIPAATEALSLEVVGNGVEIVRAVDGSYERVRVSLPAVVSIAGAPSVRTSEMTQRIGPRAGLVKMDAEALGGDPAGYGIRGSATYVQAVAEPPEREGRRVTALADGVAGIWELAARHSTSSQSARDMAGPSDALPEDAAARELWVIVECDDGTLASATAEALGAARAIAAELRGAVVAVVLGTDLGDLEARLWCAGADRVLFGRSPALARYCPERYAQALSRLLSTGRPIAVIGAFQTHQRDWLPRVAARHRFGMTGDFIGLAVAARPGADEIKDLVWLKPAWSGGALARVVARTVPSFGTLRAGVARAFARSGDAGPTFAVETVDLNLTAEGSMPEPLDGQRSAHRGIDAEIVVVVGALDVEAFAAAKELAARLGAGLGGTPAAVAIGLVPPVDEVSLVTSAISPRLAIGVGIGDPSELIALASARILVTVGTDGPVHGHADLAVVLASMAELTAAQSGTYVK